MSFNPHEILQRLRSQQNTNHNSGGSSSNYTNSNPPNTNNNFDSNGELLLGLQQHPQSFNQAQYNNIQLQSNLNNNSNNFNHAAMSSRNSNNNNSNNQFVGIGQQQQQQQQQSQQQSQQNAHNSLRNSSNLSGGRVHQGQAQTSPSRDSIKNNRQFNNQQFQQVSNQGGMNRQNQRVQEKVPQNEGNSGNRLDQYEELNNLNSNNENDINNNNTNNIQNGNNTNSIVEYLLDKVTFLEKQVMENTTQKQNILQDKRNNLNSNQNSFPKQTISPSRRAQTETLYDEVAQVISKEPVQKILQKKEKNFVSCASTNSKRFHAPKVAGKLNLEQLQKILTDYPSLSRPSLNIRITEADLMQ